MDAKVLIGIGLMIIGLACTCWGFRKAPADNAELEKVDGIFEYLNLEEEEDEPVTGENHISDIAPEEDAMEVEADNVYRYYEQVPLTLETQVAVQELEELYGVPHLLIFAVAKKESAFGPSAIGDNGQSLGMCQINVVNWERMEKLGLDLMDPIDNLTACAILLKELHAEFGSWEKAITAYNRGATGCRTWYTTHTNHPAYTIDVLTYWNEYVDDNLE